MRAGLPLPTWVEVAIRGPDVLPIWQLPWIFWQEKLDPLAANSYVEMSKSSIENPMPSVTLVLPV